MFTTEGLDLSLRVELTLSDNSIEPDKYKLFSPYINLEYLSPKKKDQLEKEGKPLKFSNDYAVW
jgi:hypothetical protein